MSLVDEIKQFQKEKKFLFGILVVIGLFGLIFPVIPGLVLIVLGVSLINPRLAEQMKIKMKKWIS